MSDKIKCSRCGRSFDYGKYFGICPKCGTYTRKEASSAGGEARQGDAWQENFADWGYSMPGKSYGTGKYEGIGEVKEESADEMAPGRRLHVLLLFCAAACVLGIVAACAGYIASTSMADKEAVNGAVEILRYEPEDLISVRGHTYQVHSAKTVIPAGKEPLIPEGQKALAIYLTAVSEYPLPSENCMETPYISFLNRHRKCVPYYDFEDFAEKYACGDVLSDYELNVDAKADGCIIYFVDADVLSVVLCFEERGEGEIYRPVSKIHEVKLEVDPNGEGGEP